MVTDRLASPLSATPSDEEKPLVDSRPVLQRYYDSLESRIGYRLFLGGTRHFGYYPSSRSFPLPISRALRAMESQLFMALRCAPGSRILDAGCGIGHVAIYMAKRGGYTIDALDIVPRHVAKARLNVANAGLSDSISVRHGDYHHLERFPDKCLDGIYTMETLVHSTDPLQVLREFRRILKPGGRLAMHEYDHQDLNSAPKALSDSMKRVNKYAAMPANDLFDKDVLKDLVQQAGFEDVRLVDMTDHVIPMMWLFYIFAVVPLYILRFLGIEHHFVNTLAGAEMYRGRHLWRYIQITGQKPC